MKRNSLLVAFLFASALMGCKNTKETLTATASACIDPSKIQKDRACTMQYDPVCGCDGKTYSNACMAENAGVTSYTKGDCATKSNSN